MTVFYCNCNTRRRRFDSFLSHDFNNLSLTIGRILSSNFIKVGRSIFASLLYVQMFIDLFVKWSIMYFNWKFVIGRPTLSVKNFFFSVNPFYSFTSDLYEIYRERILAFFVIFPFWILMKEVDKLYGELGDFVDVNSEIGILYII